MADRSDWAGRPVCVAGLGISGVAAAEALLRLGARVTVVDQRAGDAEQSKAEALRVLGADVRLGSEQVTAPPQGTSLVVTSPGWRPTQPLLQAALEAGVPVWGEPELAWRLRRSDPAPWIAVTGTNGKTTTVGMLAAMLTAAGRRTIAAGNVGVPLVQAVLADPPYDVLAVELSSFQLHWSRSIRPAAAAVLNVAPDHLDWHGSFTAYASDKHRIWADPVNSAGVSRVNGRWDVVSTLVGHDAPQIPVAVGNADDEVAAVLLAAAYASRRVEFTLREPAPGQFGVRGEELVDDAAQPLAHVQAVRPAGPHNVANALAAAALARAVGVPRDAVARGLAAYRPGGHRNATVAIVGGVRYVDDSKATNPHAAAASLSAYGAVVWIAGGLLKGALVEDLVRAHANRLRGAVLIGRDREEIRDALERHAPQVPVVDLRSAEDGVMREAVRAAARLARPGDTVLLAPAAASMDLFRDYAARGVAFAAAVEELAG